MAPYAIGGLYAYSLDRDDDGHVGNAAGENYERLAEWIPEPPFATNGTVDPAG